MNTSFIPQDYGPAKAMQFGAIANGTTRGTGTLILKEYTAFTVVAANGVALLPSGVSFVHLVVQNLDQTNSLIVMPGNSDDVVNGLSPGDPVAIAPGSSAEFICYDPPLAEPTTWYAR